MGLASGGWLRRTVPSGARTPISRAWQDDATPLPRASQAKHWVRGPPRFDTRSRICRYRRLRPLHSKHDARRSKCGAPTTPNGAVSAKGTFRRRERATLTALRTLCAVPSALYAVRSPVSGGYRATAARLRAPAAGEKRAHVAVADRVTTVDRSTRRFAYRLRTREEAMLSARVPGSSSFVSGWSLSDDVPDR